MKFNKCNYAIIGVMTFGCLALVLPAHASPDPTTQLAAIYAKTDTAADHKDIDGCLAYHSPNFLALNSNGKVETTDQQRERLTKLFSSVSSLDVTTHIEHCDFADKTATVIITQHIKTMVTDPDTGKSVPVSGDDRARVLWTNGPSGWQTDVVQTLQAAEMTPDQQ